MKRIFQFSFIFLSVLFNFSSGFSQQATGPVLREVRVGMIVDGPWERNDEILELSKREILALTERSYEVTFPPEKMIVGEWSMESVSAAVGKLMADPEVDVVITWGLIASDVASRLPDYPKPVIAPVIINPEVQGLPLVSNIQGTRSSGVSNLAYVTWNSQLAEDLEALHAIRPYKTLVMMVNRFGVAQNPRLIRNIGGTAASLSFVPRMIPIPVGFSVEEALAQIPPEAEAVYLAPLLHLGREQWDRLVSGLLARKLATFSLMGRSEVERGVLAGLAKDTDFKRLSRRVALNLKRALDGEDAGTFDVDFERGSQLTINMKTARAIGVYPSWGLLTEAELIEEERDDVLRRLTLQSAVDEAVISNLGLRANERRVAEGLERVRLAESVLRPQVGVSGLGYFIDKDRAVSSFGTQGQANLTGTAFASQLLYSESAGANVEIEKSFQLSREEEREQLRLDVVQAAASAYLSVLRAKAFEGISKQNLGRTRKNLEIARNRVRTGVASRAEVLRWKNEISTNRREVIRANALRNQAEIEVNRLLNRPLEESFRTEEAGLNDPVLLTSFTRISRYIGDPWSFRVFREFMVGEGIANSPELGRLDAKLQAQRRAVLSAERAFWAPTLGLQGDIGARASAGGGSLPPVEGFPEPGHVDWTVAVSLDFPLFTGGGRRAELAGARQELERMLLERESVAEVTEQKIRSALHGAGASFASIDLAQESLDSARQNLELVADSYRQGLVSIVELIDAQSSTLVSEQVAANAIYDYLVDLMNVQRAVGRFDFFASPAEQTEWLQRLETFFRQRNP